MYLLILCYHNLPAIRVRLLAQAISMSQLGLQQNGFPVGANKRNRISSAQWWFLAWSSFFSAMVVFHSFLFPGLLRYQNIISRFFTIYPFKNVVNYDVQFRQKLATIPNLPWDRVDSQYNSALERKFHPIHRIHKCYLCGSSAHGSHACDSSRPLHSST